MFHRNRSNSQSSLTPKDQVVRGRPMPMSIDDDANDHNEQNGKVEGGKRRTFLGMHIGGSKESNNRRQSFSNNTNVTPLPPQLNGNPRSSSSQGRNSAQIPRINANPTPPPPMTGMQRIGSRPDGRPMEGQIMDQHPGPGPLTTGRTGSSDGTASKRLGAPAQIEGRQEPLANNGNGNGSFRIASPVTSGKSIASSRAGMASPQTMQANPPHRRPSTINPALERVFKPLMELIYLHSKKMYGASPPEVEMIFARTPQGGQPKQGTPGSPRNDWDEVWMQLSGTSLSVWSMKETKEADQRGERVPPTYYNVTDSSLELLAPLPPPPHRAESHPHPYVFSLNTAGSNRILLSCRNEANLALWVTALRLSAYEKSRIEEIYTGHLLRTFVKNSGRGPPTVPANSEEKANWNEPETPLQKGRMEGWVRVRVMGGTEWKRLWLVLSSPVESDKVRPGTGTSDKRRRSLFGFGGGSTNDQPTPTQAGVASTNEFGMTSNAKDGATAVFYTTPPVKGTGKTKGQSAGEAVLTVTHVTQAYAVFPEHLEVITSSNLLKLVGNISGTMVVVEGRPRLSGWAMVMPERTAGDMPVSPNGKDDAGIVAGLLRWVVGFHDAFGLYGRKNNYNWDRDDPESLFFGYHAHPGINKFFIDPAQALKVDYRQDIVANVRQAYAHITVDKLLRLRNGEASPTASSPSLSRLANPYGSPTQQGFRPSRESPSSSYRSSRDDSDQRTPEANRGSPQDQSPMLPPLAFPTGDAMSSNESLPLRQATLTPITERSYVATTRSPSLATMGDRPGKQGGSFSSKEKKTSGSGSTRAQYLSRRGSFNNRLDAALVAETSKTASVSDDRMVTDEGSSGPYQTTPRSTTSTLPPPAGNKTELLHPTDVLASYHSDLDTDQADDDANGLAPPLPTVIPLFQNGRNGPSMPDSHDPGRAGTAPMIAPKPRKASEQFDEDQVLHDNHYLIDAIQLNEPENDRSENQDKPTAIPPSVSPVTSRNGLGRKPSGARSMPRGRQASTTSTAASLSPVPPGTTDTPPVAEFSDRSAPHGNHLPPSASMNADAMAALAFVDTMASPGKTASRQEVSSPTRRQPLPPTQPTFRSSFAPTKTAQERKERAEQAEKDKEHVLTRPGKAGGKKLKKAAWSASSEDESEDNSNEDDSGDEDDEELQPPSRINSGFGSRPGSDAGRRSNSASPRPNLINRSNASPAREGSQLANEQSVLGRGMPMSRPPLGPDQSRQRVSRNLPPIPGQQRNSIMDQQRSFSTAGHGGNLHIPGQGGQDRSMSWAGGPASATESMGPPVNQDLNQLGSGRVLPQPKLQARQSMWTSALDAPHAGTDDEPTNGKFVTLEPSAHLTKAFTPHGLLQAGLQDKEDRSAKKQQELAKETGASLLNVPGKPAEPQTGLLGAITAHERDRKGAGGLGAALTERERDRRLAEERQRQIDEMQSLQRQTMYMGGDPYARPMSTFNGMGGGAMMPSMPYGQTPGMYWPQPPMNPYAQQQAMMAAQMAYQSSMYMAMSQAGSQVGTPDGNMASPGAFDGRASPMMTPNPYMSMYGGYAPSMAGFSGGMPGMMGPGSPLAYPPTGSVMGGNQAASPSAANQNNYGDRKQDERR